MWGELVGLALVAGVLFWLLRGRNAGATSGNESTAALSYEEMEAADELRQAEDEVRERGTKTQPEDEEPGDDWGPGTSRSY